MTDRETRLREIRERVEMATPGPWIGTGGSFGVPDEDGDTELCLGDVYERLDESFIAHAREDVPWLLDLVDEYKFDPAERTYLECRVRNLEGDLAFYLNEDPETKAKVDRWREIMDKEPHELEDAEREELAALTAELVEPTPDPDPAERWCALRRENERLLAEVERLRDELDGVKCELELRKTLHVQPEESEHIARTSDLLIRVLAENDELRAEVERLSDGELLRISKQLDIGTAAFDYPGSAVDG